MKINYETQIITKHKNDIYSKQILIRKTWHDAKQCFDETIFKHEIFKIRNMTFIDI